MNEVEKASSKPKNILAILLVLVVLGGLIFLVTRYVMNGEEEETSSPELAIETLVDNLKEGNLDYISESTNLEGKMDFASWDDIKVANVGDFYRESDTVALVRVDFEFSKDLDDEEVFEYPLTLVFVVVEEEGEWIVDDIEFDLQRHNEAAGDAVADPIVLEEGDVEPMPEEAEEIEEEIEIEETE